MELLDDIYTIPREETRERTHRVERIDTIRLEGVSYTYLETGEYAVDNASFTVRSGETTALVGPSGSGKSTTIKLLLGLYHPDTGTVHVNGEDLETVELASYRKRIGIVTQESQLFATSIRENLLFVAPEAEDERLMEVLEQAEVAHVVERSEDGLGAKIGEGGIKLSGGERQRLAIARALLRNPDVLLLDEATSSLDSVTEQKITRTVQRIGEQNQGLAVVVIAHRLSTVIHADHIHVLKNGSVQETGTHKELLHTSELYKSLWNVQNNQTI
jgi:ATP-binding cassette subfamily B protein